MPESKTRCHPASVPELIKQIQQVFENTDTRCQPLSCYSPPARLREKLDLTLSDEGCDQSEIITALRQYLHYTPKTWQAKFNKLLFSGSDASAILADWVTSLSNTTMHTYQVAPVATLMEHELIERLNQIVGFDQGDGIMVSGGSMANTVAMMLARHQACPHIRERGFSARPLVAYVSELAHYSFEKAANILGIGTQNLISVRSDDQGCMLPKALKLAIKHSLKEDKQPFFIGLTAGTTVVGSFDPIAESARIARHYKLWLHIDGAWGGPVLFSEKHRHLLADSALADSFTWDAHKLMNVPLIASAILVKERHHLQKACGGGGGAYLFHHDENAAYDLGDKSLQCGRRVDSLKFWLSWKASGNLGYATKIDKLMALKVLMLEVIAESTKLELLAPAGFLNVLFRVVPGADETEDQLAKINTGICKVLLEQDTWFVDYATYKGQLGIRFILANDQLSKQHIHQFLDHCLRIGTANES